MKRLAITLLPLLVIASRAPEARAQAAVDPAAEPPAPPPPSDQDITPTAQKPGDQLEGGAKPADGVVAAKRYEDIVVVPRKAFLKTGRFEFFPRAGISVSDQLIRHYSLGGELNYFLSDVFWIGIEGQYFVKERTDRHDLIGLQFNRIPTVNKYLYSAALNFGYVPIYGKFTLFNRYIMHWEIYATAGAGVTQSEIIPRHVGDKTFKSMLITPNFGVGARFFISQWLTFNVAFKDYVFSDKFEPIDRRLGESIESVKSRASSQLVNHMMVFAGVGLYLPPTFDYKSPR